MSLRASMPENPKGITRYIHPTADSMIGNIDFVCGKTMHVPGRLIYGSICHTSRGFEVGRKNAKYSKQNKKQNMDSAHRSTKSGKCMQKT